MVCKTPKRICREYADQWEYFPGACGDCENCENQRVNDYVGRGLSEAAYSDWTVTLTLTYRETDQHRWTHKTYPPHLQKFIRAVRRRGHKIRYIGVGEYGANNTERAHFHVVLFGKGPRLDYPQKERYWRKEWPHGHMFADWSANPNAIYYCLKYLKKPQADGSKAYFTLSKKPPLGDQWLMEYADAYVAAGLFPSTLSYFPPGGLNDRWEYMITGATRRNFLLRIYEGFGKNYPKTSMNEWVLKSLETFTLAEAKELGEQWMLKNPEAALRALNEDLDKKRISMYWANRNILRDHSEEVSETYKVLMKVLEMVFNDEEYKAWTRPPGGDHKSGEVFHERKVAEAYEILRNRANEKAGEKIRHDGGEGAWRSRLRWKEAQLQGTGETIGGNQYESSASFFDSRKTERYYSKKLKKYAALFKKRAA